MDHEYNGYQTRDKLMDALNDEAVGHVKYMLWGKKAEDEGFQEIADNFYNTADDELAHAEMWMKELGMMGDTTSNLVAAIADETADSTVNYPSAANTAEKEGFDALKKRFLDTASVEKRHKEAYTDRLESLNQGTVFYSGNPETEWACSNCGYVSEGEAAPKHCPLCGYPQGYFFKM